MRSRKVYTSAWRKHIARPMLWRMLRWTLRTCLIGAALFVLSGCISRFYYSPTAAAPSTGAHAPHPVTRTRAQTPETAAESPVHFRGPTGATEDDEPTPPSLQTDTSTALTRTGSAFSGMGMFGQLEGIEYNTNLMPGETPGNVADNLTRITYTHEGADFDPAVAPDGRRLVFASTRHRRTEDLYLKQVDGTTITQLTDDPARDVMPTFSPDGSRIAFASDRSGTWDIYLIDAGGGRTVQITDDRHHNIHPSFSPDGKRLVYSSYSNASDQWQMVVVDLDQPGTRHYIGPGLFPSWSPTAGSGGGGGGGRILFQRARQRGTHWFSIWTVDLDAAGQAGSPTEIVASTNAAVITPAWGPDGKHIVFCTVSDQGADDQQRTAVDLWIVRGDGTGRVRLTGGQFADLQPTWASDGTIYFVSDRSRSGNSGSRDVENIWAIRPDEGL